MHFFVLSLEKKNVLCESLPIGITEIPKTTWNAPLSVGKLGGKNRRLSELERLTSVGFLIKHAASRAAESLWRFQHAGSSMLITRIALTLGGWILYVAYSGESDAQSFIQTTHVAQYCIVYVFLTLLCSYESLRDRIELPVVYYWAFHPN